MATDLYSGEGSLWWCGGGGTGASSVTVYLYIWKYTISILVGTKLAHFLVYRVYF